MSVGGYLAILLIACGGLVGVFGACFVMIAIEYAKAIR